MRSNRWRHFALLVAVAASGCDWLSLGANAISYETLRTGEAGNIVARDSLAYVTLGEEGLAVVDGATGRRLATLAPPRGLESIDDVALDGDFLYLLDARPPGALAVASVADSSTPRVVEVMPDVGVGPFSGVSARDGLVAVSGGTSTMTVWRRETDGRHSHLTDLDLGRGQPDVLIACGDVVFVSTHYWGPYFGLDVVRREPTDSTLKVSARLRLPRAGFTAGGAKPANFPIEAAILDDRTVLVAHLAGLAVVDIVAPDSLRLRTVIDVGGPAVNVDVRDRTAFVAVAGPTPHVAQVTFSDRGSWSIARTDLPPGTNPLGIASVGRNVLVAARDRGVLVVTH